MPHVNHELVDATDLEWIAEEHRLSELKEAADAGNADAQFNWAQVLFYGEWMHGIPVNHADAILYLIRSANQDNQDAQVRLGEIYYFGFGVKEDEQKGLFWWRRAAELGNGRAAWLLGDHGWNNSIPVSEAERQCREWYSRAKSLGYQPEVPEA